MNAINCIREKLELKKDSEQEKKFSAAVENFVYRKALFDEFKRIYYSDFSKLNKEEKLMSILLNILNIQKNYLFGDLSKVLIFLAIKDCVENTNLFNECYEVACKHAKIVIKL